jgi:SAM-dependent methyltransferase
VRAFVAARLLLLPLKELEPELRELHGRVLSLGAGYGAVERYVAALNTDVEAVDGVELDEERVALSARAGGPVTLRAGDVRDAVRGAQGAYDSALAIDLFHHVPAEQHEQLLRGIAGVLAPGGVLILKDIARTPRWQYGWNRLHDRLVAGPEPIHCREPGEMAALALGNGFATARGRRVGRLEPYPHYVLDLRAAS